MSDDKPGSLMLDVYQQNEENRTERTDIRSLAWIVIAQAIAQSWRGYEQCEVRKRMSLRIRELLHNGSYMSKRSGKSSVYRSYLHVVEPIKATA